MPKYLYQASYTADGMRGLQKDTASGRMASAKAAIKSAGGKLESMYFSFGQDDVLCIVDFPDNATAASLSVAIAASGMVHGIMTPLLTAGELDKGLGKKMKYKAPGSGS